MVYPVKDWGRKRQTTTEKAWPSSKRVGFSASATAHMGTPSQLEGPFLGGMYGCWPYNPYYSYSFVRRSVPPLVPPISRSVARFRHGR